MSKHSPGPWRVDMDKPDAEVIDARGLEIARVYFDSDRRNDDARLIAAAPEMLAVLKDIVRSGAIDGDMRKTDAQALIRRIEGEE